MLIIVFFFGASWGKEVAMLCSYNFWLRVGISYPLCAPPEYESTPFLPLPLLASCCSFRISAMVRMMGEGLCTRNNYTPTQRRTTL